jgi:RsiW-degrading membrane proteinase PrsW (M82 family)
MTQLPPAGNDPEQAAPGEEPRPGGRTPAHSGSTYPMLGGPAHGYPTPGMALAAAPPTPHRFQWRRVLLLVGLVAFIALCGIGLLAYVGYNIGPTALAVGIVAAIIPVPVLVFCFLWLDRYEPEPVKYLAFCLAWGACVATAVALLVNSGASALFKHYGLPDTLVAVLTAPFIEETMKALGPFLLLLVRRRTFSGVVDGIVYCGLSATGFAMVENILYLGGYGYAAGADKGGVAAGVAGVIAVFIGRIVFSGFAHPLFTSMTGIGLGVAARSGDRRVRWLAPIAGWLTAMILHGSWNLMSVLAQQTQQSLIMLYGYFSVMMPIFFGMVGFALWLRSWEGRLTQRVLPDYVRTGWFSPPEVATLATMGRRQSARTWAKRVAGDPGAQAMRAYQFAATRLALLRDGLRRGLAMRPDELAQTLAEERQLLDAISQYRAVFTGRDPRTPRAIWDGSQYHVTFPDGSVRALNPSEQPVVPVPVVLVPYR